MTEGILSPQGSRRWDVCPPAVTRRLWGWGTACTRRWQPSRLSLCLRPTGEKRCPTSEWARPRARPWSKRAAFCQSASLWGDAASSDCCCFPLQWHGSAAVQWHVLWEVGVMLSRDPFTLHGVRTETKDRRWLRLCSLSNAFSLGFSPTRRQLDCLLALQLPLCRKCVCFFSLPSSFCWTSSSVWDVCAPLPPTQQQINVGNAKKQPKF